MLSALEKSEKGARRMKRACDSFKLRDLVSWLILVYKVFPQMFKSDSFSCKGYNIWQSLKRMQHLKYELFQVIYLNAWPLRALAPLGKIIKGVFLLLLKYRLPCWLPHSTDMFVHHFRKWNSCIMKTRWLVIWHVLDDILQKCFIGSRRILHIWQKFKFWLLIALCAAVLDFSEI